MLLSSALFKFYLLTIIVFNAAIQMQIAVTAHFPSKQLLLFAFEITEWGKHICVVIRRSLDVLNKEKQPGNICFSYWNWKCSSNYTCVLGGRNCLMMFLDKRVGPWRGGGGGCGGLGQMLIEWQLQGQDRGIVIKMRLFPWLHVASPRSQITITVITNTV